MNSHFLFVACAVFASSLPASAQCQTWSGTGGGINGPVYALTVFDDGVNGPCLYAGGDYTQAGGTAAIDVARWNGDHWTALSASGLVDVRALLGVEDAFGAGRTVYAGGHNFSECGGLVRVSGAGPVPPHGFIYGLGRIDPVVNALAMFDSGTGPHLYIGGEFDEEGCFTPIPNSLSCIARWDGSSLTSVGTGMDFWVYALTVFDDGSGPALYAGGAFAQAGGIAADHVAKWNGSTWSAVGSGVPSSVNALCVFDDGSGAGPQLYAASFGVRKWDGATWSLVGGGTNQWVYSLAVFDDGSGPALYAGGAFTTAGGNSANRIAKWDGMNWSALGSGTNNRVLALVPYDDGLGGGPDLYAGGEFTTAGGMVLPRVAEWHGCQHDGASYCAGDDVDPLVTTDCPCGNFGEPNHGCGNFPFTNGARLTASGTTSPNTMLFTCTDVPNNTLCTFLRGNNNVAAGFVFGDGVRCVQVPLLRFGQQNSGQGGNPPSTVASATVTELPGITRYYQCQYRNPTGGWCDPGLFNVSNGYVLQW